MSSGKFTIRVYGIIFRSGSLMLSKELILGKSYVKFPGGGLEFGEGTRSALEREIFEETGWKARVKEHFYTTDFFQRSSFHPFPTQVISIYYFADIVEERVDENIEPEHELIWLPEESLSPAAVDLPIDKVVMKQLISVRQKLI